MIDKKAKVLEALLQGTILAIGGTVYANKRPLGSPLCNTTDLVLMRDKGLPIQRVDAGGSPTWELLPKTRAALKKETKYTDKAFLSLRMPGDDMSPMEAP